MKNEETAAVLTRLFRELVLAMGNALDSIPIGDERVWELARTFHTAWRTALRSLRTPHKVGSTKALSGHQAMQELVGLIDAAEPAPKTGKGGPHARPAPPRRVRS